MTGAVVQDGDIWVWRAPGQGDLLLRHNEWGKTPAAQDMPRLAGPLAQLPQLVAAARTAAADEFYTLWQDSWKQEGDPDLRRAEFEQALILLHISYPSAQFLHSHFDLLFEDAGLFRGHLIAVVFKMDGSVAQVDLFG